MRRALAATAAALLVACAGAAPAHAGTLRLSEDVDPGDSQSDPMSFVTVRYTARPGDVNDVTFSVADERLTLRDRVPITVGRGCERAGGNPREAVCRLPIMPPQGADFDAIVDAGDGDDRVAIGASDMEDIVYDPEALGGPGDDVLTAAGADVTGDLDGGDGDDRLDGGPERDFLRGGPGTDDVRGAGGDDLFSEGPLTGGSFAGAVGPVGPTGDDRLDGGAGADTVTYFRRRAPVRVNLTPVPPPSTPTQPAAAPATGGEGTERDVLLSFENAEGGDGDDELVGDDGPNALGGGEGDDELAGRGGRDVLNGDVGRDAFDGGAGGDRVESGASAGDAALREVVTCGAGLDVVDETDVADVLDRDCEQVALSSFPGSTRETRAPAHPALRRRVLSLMAACPRPLRRCTGSLRVRSRPGGRTLGIRRGRLTRRLLPLRVGLRGAPPRTLVLELRLGRARGTWSVPSPGPG